jgi:hypothetical protein
MYHCIGDSHSLIFRKDMCGKDHEALLETFVVHHIGPYLAFNFENSHESFNKTIDILRSLERTDTIILSFGEIDCRCHILKQKYEKSRCIEDIVEEITTKYTDSVKDLCKMTSNIFLLAPAPTGNFDNDYTFNKEFPFYGTYRERNRVTQMFIDSLEKKYDKVVSVFSIVINKDYSTKMEYFRDMIHLSSEMLPYILKRITM